MKTVELGRTGEQVSQLSLGCMIMGTSTDEATAVRMLDHYVEAGGTFLDTANRYGMRPGSGARDNPGSGAGTSETYIGRALKERGSAARLSGRHRRCFRTSSSVPRAPNAIFRLHCCWWRSQR